MAINEETGRWNGKFSVGNLSKEETPVTRGSADLAEYVKMVQMSKEQDQTFGIDVTKGAETILISQLRRAAKSVDLGLRVQVVDKGDDENVRVKFYARPIKVRKVAAVETTTMTAAQKRAAQKTAATKQAVNKTPAGRRAK